MPQHFHWSKVGVGKLANILTVGSKLYNFHNLHTNHYVSLGLGLSKLFPPATQLKELVLQNNRAIEAIRVKNTEGQDQNMKDCED